MSMLKLYGILIRASIRSRMQYKFNFIFSSVMAAFINIVEFLLIAILLSKFGHIKGWSLYEVGYLYSVLILSRSIYRSLASDVHHIERYLVNGELDQLLIRPIPILLALMTQNFTILLGEFLQGSIILIICIQGLMASGQMTLTAIPLTIVIIVSGAVVLFTIGLVSATSGFWITRVRDLQNITEDATHTAARYPLLLYPKWLQLLLVSILPVGLVNYVPALYILRGQFGPWLLILTTSLAALFLWLGLRLWRVGLSKYQSTGS
ncbi:ABC transporter permease [Paenibacillus sp. J2TS4]|uniref:ABC transporter permease n=1 Tax=Paenibacillus sp. J2TS4 TaxID=2807194 RepID=UPI001B2A83AB|nr:ABC-2 family transporter protein [Paenibacillus sp. J2TS4]GIP33819.1 ABC transporter permease [Paenibacillus sp. J2TS4]